MDIENKDNQYINNIKTIWSKRCGVCEARFCTLYLSREIWKSDICRCNVSDCEGYNGFVKRYGDFIYFDWLKMDEHVQDQEEQVDCYRNFYD